MSPQVANNYTSIDPDEVARFEALANTWWDTSGPFWPLHRLNELRVGYIRDTVCRAFGRDAGSSFPLQGLSILDIGCGGGILSEAMAALGGEVHSIDVVARNIAIARHHAGQSNLSVRYEALAAEQLVCRRDCYDVVLNMEVVEHVADLSSFLRACSQLVKGGGLMFIATINRTPLAWLTAILGAEYVLRWLPRGTHRWRRFPKPNELEGLLAEDGLRIIARQGVGVNPFKRRMFLTRFTSVNYMLVAQKAGQ